MGVPNLALSGESLYFNLVGVFNSAISNNCKIPETTKFNQRSSSTEKPLIFKQLELPDFRSATLHPNINHIPFYKPFISLIYIKKKNRIYTDL